MPLSAPPRRRRLSLTSLIDVIFLLLLFFMLSSTFSRFAEVELQAGGAGGPGAVSERPPLFLRLLEDGAELNGTPIDIADLPQRIEAEEGAKTLLVSLSEATTAQALTDVLVVLRRIPALDVSVLEPS